MRILAAAMLWLLCAAHAPGQSLGEIRGSISDVDGKAVPRTPVQATQAGTGAVHKANSSATGEYVIGALPEGVYEVSVITSAVVFRPFVRQGISVRAGQSVRLDIRLEDGVTLNTLGEDREAIAQFFRRPPPPQGPTPRLADGKPDLSGFWMPSALPDDPSVAPAKIEALPWAEAVARQRVANDFKNVPSARCLPNGITVALGGFQFVHSPGLLAMLFEGDYPRQVFLDGRAHPKDPNPSWLGHSVGRWEGDTLVVDTVGFNDKTWLDMDGHPHTEMLHVTERFHRRDLGHMDGEMTVEDLGALAKPWIVKRAWALDPKEEIRELLCTENERDAVHLK